MKRFQSLIASVEQASQLLDTTIEQQRALLTLEFSRKITVAHQKVSLAEKRIQVKNARSPEWSIGKYGGNSYSSF